MRVKNNTSNSINQGQTRNHTCVYFILLTFFWCKALSLPFSFSFSLFSFVKLCKVIFQLANVCVFSTRKNQVSIELYEQENILFVARNLFDTHCYLNDILIIEVKSTCTAFSWFEWAEEKTSAKKQKIESSKWKSNKWTNKWDIAHR